MITEKLIREAYVHLRTTNQSIPDEVLDFMLKASLGALDKQRQDKLDDLIRDVRVHERLSTSSEGYKKAHKELQDYIAELQKT